MNTRLAEWILSAAFPPDRAASAIGDWTQEACERGSIWFWQCVLRTVGAQVWHDLTQSPLLMARLGIWGFAKNMLVPVGMLALLFIILVTSDNHTDIRYRHDWIFTWIMANTQKNPSLPPNFNLTLPFQIVYHFLWAAQVFRTSRWIARRAPDRQIAICTAVAVTGWLAIFSLDFWSRYGTSLFRPKADLSAIPLGIAHDLILFAGAIWTTRQIRSHTARI